MCVPELRPCDKDKEQLLASLQENWHEAYKMLIS